MNWFQKTILARRFWLGQNKFSNTRSNLSVTIVIPAWNEEEFIVNTIDSVLMQDYPCNIIVVNDCSTDKTGEIARSYQNIQVIDVIDKQGSKSQALNYAIPFVETDIFVCIDADTELAPDALGLLMTAFNNPNVYVACGFVVSDGGSNFWEAGRRGDYLTGHHICKAAQENANAVLVASGCFFGIRTDFLKIHNFDERTMAEDMDLTWRAVEEGYDVAFVKNAFCYVVDPNTWYLYDKQMTRWFSGFFQNIKERNYDLFSKNPKLGIVVYGYIFLALVGMPATILSMFWFPVQTVQLLGFGYLLLVSSTMISAYKHEPLKRLITYPLYVAMLFVISVVNFFIFIKCGYKELFTTQTLNTWVKGH